MELNQPDPPVAEIQNPAPAVMLVCNDSGHCEELSQLLRSQNWRVLLPPNLTEAIRRMEMCDLLLIKTEVASEPLFNTLKGLAESPAGWRVPVVIIVDKPDPPGALKCLSLGADDCLAWPMNPDWLLARIRGAIHRKHLHDQEQRIFEIELKAKQEAESLVSSLLAMGVEAVRQKDPIKLLELILSESMRLTDCEGGTIYLRTDDNRLRFVLVRNDMVDLNMGGTAGKPISWQPLRLYDDAGRPVTKYVACQAALSGQIINVEDAYTTTRYDFSGTKQFDASTGYRSKSFLTVPLKNERQQVIGVLQLINARDSKTGAIVPFDSSLQPAIEAFSVLAAAVLDACRPAVESASRT